MGSAVEQVQLVSGDGLKLDAAVQRGDGEPSGCAVLAHGITVDMDEGGMFVRLADRLVGAGFTVLRFSFRGHGGSEGTQAGVTIAGEMLDFQAAVDFAAREFTGPLSVTAASFGAVSACLSLPYLEPALRSLVLWNPVLDVMHTFVEPELPWGLENFNADQHALLGSHGFLLVDYEFRLGRVLFEEFRHYRPCDHFARSRVPALVIHGDRDGSVSYEIARKAAMERPETEFYTVPGSDHGFDSREREDEAITQTVDWLLRRHR